MPAKKKTNKLSKNTKIYLMISISFVALTIFVYFNFQQYQPKALKQLKDVKTIEGEESFLLPYPQNSTKVSIDKTATSEQTTFHTTKAVTEVRDFYKNALLSKDWKIETESSQDESIHIQFKNKEATITVNAFEQNSGTETLVTIDVVENN